MYRVATRDYHMCLQSDKFETVEEAVKFAIENSYGLDFEILKDVEYDIIERREL